MIRKDGILKTEFLGFELRNPFLLASGVAGYGREFHEQVGLEGAGGLIIKTITKEPRVGNPQPRVCETPSGMLNSIGLANSGLEYFIDRELSFLENKDIFKMVSIASDSPEGLAEMAVRLDGIDYIQAIELNLSCPNVHTEMQFAQDPETTYSAVRAVKEAVEKPVIAKLSPNVTDISIIAGKAVEGGADALSLINTLTGIKVDPVNRRYILGNITGGLSGPAIRPVGVKMVRDIKMKFDIPVIAHGGICDYLSALEYILVGADLIALGSALFKEPYLVEKIVADLKKYLINRSITLDKIRGELI